MTSIPPEHLPEAGDVPEDVAHAIASVALRAGQMGRRVYWLETTDSTNDVAARLAESGADEGTIVVAEMQTAGRGRQGRAWFSPPGAGLYVSIVVRPGTEITDNATLLTLATGVAIAEAVRVATGLPAELKWPNDVMIAGRKLAGILAESAVHGNALQFVVVGFGVNMRRAAYPHEIASRVTSIEAETSRAPDRGLILAEIVARLAERYSDLRARRFDAILSAWRTLASSFSGARIEWDSPSGIVRGRFEDIDSQGALLMRVGDKLERVVAGEVRWL